MKKQRKMGPWTLVIDALFLFLALTSTVFGAVTVYHMAVKGSALWVGALVLTLFMVGLVNLPKYRLPVMLGVLALWAWGLWKLWEPLVWGGTRLQCDVVNTIAAKVPGVAAIVPIAELPDEMWVQTATLWIGMVGVVYALALALLLCRLRRALPVILWTLLPILPALCVTEAPNGLPMAGLLAVWLTLILTSMTDRRDPRGTARLRPVVLICVLLVLEALTIKLSAQGTAQPLWAADIREAVINEASRGDFSALLTRWSGWMGAGSTEYMNLIGNAPAHTGRVALRVKDSPWGKYYLRGYSADIYTGRRWEPLGKAAQEELEAIRETGTEPLLMLGEKAREESTYTYHSYRDGGFTTYEEAKGYQMTVENVAAPGGCIYYPYTIAQVPENARIGGDSHLERTGAIWEHTFTFYPDWESMLWRQGAGDRAYRDFVYEHELQVPEDLRPILEDWLRQATGAVMDDQGYRTTFHFSNLEEFVRYSKGYSLWQNRVWQQISPVLEEAGGDWNAYVQALVDDLWSSGPTQEDFDAVELTQEDLEEYGTWFRMMMPDIVINRLAQTTQYDRNTPAPPSDRDYVDWFLNESRQGYCMHYATAATLLLRTAGIPARYVSGYVVNVPWRGTAEVTDHAAHAWVEIYIDGVGWYPLEVTPGFQSNEMGDIPDLESGETQATAAPTATPSPSPTPTASQEVEEDEDDEEDNTTPSAAPTPSQAPSGQTGPGTGEERTPISPGVWYGLGAPLLLALALWGRRYLLSRRRRKLTGGDTNAAVRYAYACHQRLKPWGGRSSEELTALAEKAKFSQHTLTEAEREGALGILREESQRVYAGLPAWKKPVFTLLWGKE